MKKILTTLLLATSSLAAFADGANLYVGGAAGAGWNNTAYPATSFRLDGGYNFTDAFAVEVGSTGITQAGTGNNQSVQYYDLSVKGTLPLGSVFGLVGQIGGAYASPGVIANRSANTQFINNPAEQAGWDTLLAAGVQLNVTRQVSFNLMDYYYAGGATPQGNADMVLLGIKYNF